MTLILTGTAFIGAVFTAVALMAVPLTAVASATVDNSALARSFVALALLTIATFAPAASWDDDSHYVALGPRSGYYIVRPGSRLSHQLDVEDAPTIDSSDPFRHGYGADALAFHFNHAGLLSAAPAYTVQAKPNEFYTLRLGSLIRGRTTSRDVEAVFGRPQNIQRRSDGVVTYYAIQVYNPFEDLGGRR